MKIVYIYIMRQTKTWMQCFWTIFWNQEKIRALQKWLKFRNNFFEVTYFKMLNKHLKIYYATKYWYVSVQGRNSKQRLKRIFIAKQII